MARYLDLLSRFFHKRVLPLRYVLLFSLLCVLMGIAAFDGPYYFHDDECGYCAQKGIVAIARFSERKPSGAAVVKSLIRKGILIKILPEQVFLKPTSNNCSSRPEEIKDADYDEVWEMLSPYSTKHNSLCFFTLFFSEHNFNDPIWRDGLVNYGCGDPRLAHYIIGAADYSFFALFPKILGKKGYFFYLRFYMGLWAAAALFFFYLLVKKSVSEFAALCVLVLCLINPIFRSAQVAITYETILNLFMVISLLFLLGVERRFAFGKNALLGIVGFSIFLGLAMSCKITAMTLYPLVFLVFLMQGKKLSAKFEFFSLALIVLLSCGIFYFTNPLLMTDFKYGMKMLFMDRITRGRIDSFKSLMKPDLELLKALLTYPFVLFKPLAFEARGLIWPKKIIFDFSVTEKISMGIGYLLFVIGLIKASLNRKYLPVMFFLSNFVFFYVVFYLRGVPSLVPMHLLPLVLSILWIAGHCFMSLPGSPSERNGAPASS